MNTHNPAHNRRSEDMVVRIRRFVPADAPLLYEAVRESIAHVNRWMLWCRPDYSLADSLRFIEQDAAAWDNEVRHSFVIHDSLRGTFLGSVGLSAIDKLHQFANLGYWVRTRWTNRGVASAAVTLAAQFAFRELGMQRLELLVPVENVASLHVAKKVGAKHEGILRNRLLLHGKRHDAVLLSLIPQDLSDESHAEGPEALATRTDLSTAAAV